MFILLITAFSASDPRLWFISGALWLSGSRLWVAASHTEPVERVQQHKGADPFKNSSALWSGFLDTHTHTSSGYFRPEWCNSNTHALLSENTWRLQRNTDISAEVRSCLSGRKGEEMLIVKLPLSDAASYANSFFMWHINAPKRSQRELLCFLVPADPPLTSFVSRM